MLETKQLNFNVANQLEEKQSKNFIAIASCLCDIFETEEEVYWASKERPVLVPGRQCERPPPHQRVLH